MIKKAIIATAAVGLLGAFFLGRDVCSYVGTSATMVRDSVTDQIPTEFQIERARRMLKGLVPEIDRNVHTIAREQVEVQDLNEQIAHAEGRLAKEKVAIKRLTNDLQGGNEVFHYASQKFTRDQVKTDLNHRFERYRTHEGTLASLREMRDARQRTLEGARQNLANMMAQKQNLEVQLEKVEAKLRMLEAQQTASQYSFDSSKLSRAKKLISYLDKRMEIGSQYIDAKGEWTGALEIPVFEDDPVDDDIVDQVTAYFSEQEAQDAPQVAAVPTE